MIIVGLTGKAGSGKDTTADYLTKNYGFEKKMSFADPIKQASKILFNLSTEQLNDRHLKEIPDDVLKKSPRQLMQWLGSDVFRLQYDKDFFVNHMENRLKESCCDDKIVISDVRFSNEADMIRKLGGIIIRITRTNLCPIASNTHQSENASFEADIELVNTGESIEDLYRELQYVVEDLKKRNKIKTN